MGAEATPFTQTQTQWQPQPQDDNDRQHFIKCAGAPPEGFNVKPMWDVIDSIAEANRVIIQNPFSTKPMEMLVKAKGTLVGLARTMPAALRPVMGPLLQATGPQLEASREAVRLRMRAAHSLMKHPTQSIPLTLGLVGTWAIGNTLTFVVQNPYIGSGGAIHNPAGVWAVTAIESSALLNCRGIIFTQATFAGHDYVAASLGGLQSQTGTGIPAAADRGWDSAIFATDKRYRDHTVFSPWNLQGEGGIIGAIMRETGTLTLGIRNVGATTTTWFSGAFHVHVKASLCSSPFQDHDNVAKMFVPFQQQMAAAHHLSTFMPSHFEQLFHGFAGRLPVIKGLAEDTDRLLSQRDWR